MGIDVRLKEGTVLKSKEENHILLNNNWAPADREKYMRLKTRELHMH